jgi:lipoprotein-anchoring transpeptidase ErfK/SrfK
MISMAYDLAKISKSTLMRPAFDAAIALTRLDERIARSPVGAGWVERSQFTDACASLWIDGELVHLEDLVLHDATKDIRTPTHELTIARDVLRTRRRIIAAIDDPNQVIGSYVIEAQDISVVVGPTPKDYARMAEMQYLGYATVTEGLAERFHMGEDLLKAINPSAQFRQGETIFVADLGANRSGKAARIEVDKAKGQLRAYAEDGSLLVVDPATIGSETNPSPSGTHTIKTVVLNPNYTYNPTVNFKQGDNDKVLTLPPGPNGPVGSVWIDLSEPTFGIHGTPDPSRIDKTGSHGCVRLTNWDAEELAKLVSKDVPVKFM